MESGTFFRTGGGKLAHLENGWRKEELDPGDDGRGRMKQDALRLLG
jgi:hypothetical protein